MKRAAVATLAILIALLVAGCGGGSSSSTTQEGAPKKATAPNAPAGSKVVACGEHRLESHELRATEVSCETARTTLKHWKGSKACALERGSRGSCSVGGFRCQAVKVDAGTAVSCAGPEGDVAFIVRPAG
jgi:hypothetical protein